MTMVLWKLSQARKSRPCCLTFGLFVMLAFLATQSSSADAAKNEGQKVEEQEEASQLKRLVSYFF